MVLWDLGGFHLGGVLGATEEEVETQSFARFIEFQPSLQCVSLLIKGIIRRPLSFIVRY